mgnify:CR=1 FL=1|jgi:hypothetical protein
MLAISPISGQKSEVLIMKYFQAKKTVTKETNPEDDKKLILDEMKKVTGGFALREADKVIQQISTIIRNPGYNRSFWGSSRHLKQ